MEIPKGFCQCGCGAKTNIAPRNETRRGWIKGHPEKFIPSHNHLTNCESLGKYINNGYSFIVKHGHHRSNANGYVREHILIAEKALGKSLPSGVEIHHINGNKADNTPNNLVICQDHSYHMFIDRRTRAYRACGNAKWRKCPYCKQYDNPCVMYFFKKTNVYAHMNCIVKANQIRRQKAKLKSNP